MFDPIEFGKRMQKSRLLRGLTQEQLAERLHVDRTHITKVERGDRACSVDFLVDLSDALHVSADYLLIGLASQESVKERLGSVIMDLQKICETI